MKVVLLALAIMMPWCSFAVDIQLARQWAAKSNVSCILVFGDSSVDPGNNNVLRTSMKSNFPPYGKDFFNSLPTGRFCNGRLATDFIGKSYQPLCFFVIADSEYKRNYISTHIKILYL